METLYLDALDPALRSKSIVEAAHLLSVGQLVAFPTETVYGLGASAFDEDAISMVFAVKGRPATNPLIVHVHDIESISTIAMVDDRARALIAALMPGPLTLVLNASSLVPGVVRAGLSTVAVRIPDHPIALELLRAAGPLVGPSANVSGGPSPTTAQHVLDDLERRIAAVLDGGTCRVGIESTVLDLSANRPAILRQGRIEAATIERVIGEAVSTVGGVDERSPGTRFRHYAPRVPVRLIIADEPPEVIGGVRLVLTTRKHLQMFSRAVARVVSEEQLYAQLRTADDVGFEEVVIYAAPGELSPALLDRVTRAAGLSVR